MPAHAELQVTTNYSFLRGASHVEELLLQAKALGLAAIGITDRNTLAGVARAHARALEVGIQLVIGCRLDLQDGLPVLVYPTHRAAYGRLCRLPTLGKGRAGKEGCDLAWADMVAHGDGCSSCCCRTRPMTPCPASSPASPVTSKDGPISRSPCVVGPAMPSV